MNDEASNEADRRPVDIRVSRELDGERLDRFLAVAAPGRSRAYYQRCIREGLVLLNGRPCRARDPVSVNDVVRVDWLPEQRLACKGEATVPFEVLAEDEDMLVINKPPNVVVHPAQGNRTGTLVHGLLAYDEEHFSELLDDNLRPGIVHRLDKDTSGLLVVARTAAAWKALKLAFAERRVEKTYLALVVGEFGAVTGSMHSQIGRHPRNRTKMAVVEDGGKTAVTHYRVLASTGEITLVQVRIETGRTHQIRVHFANLRHPVLGDALYGGRQGDLPVHVERQMLHAWKLVFPHPRTGVMREYMATPPEDFQAALSALGMARIGRARVEEPPPFEGMPPPNIE